MGLGRLIFPSKGPIRGQYCFFMAKYRNRFIWMFSILIIIFTDSASYFHKIMFISLVDTLNHFQNGGRYCGETCMNTYTFDAI